MKITQHYNITGTVPFVDVDVSSDNRLFLDPHAVRLSHSPPNFVRRALACADSFTREVTDCVIGRTPAHATRGEELLQHFTEPSETRLGMSAIGFQGHGGADGIGSTIWRTLHEDVEALVRLGVLGQLEDLPLFVPGIDRDITSDVTTRIMFLPLAAFTASVVRQFDEFTTGAHRIETFERQIWDIRSRNWCLAEVELPVVHGRPLLLVPRGWARPYLLMSPRRFYETTILSFAQLEQAVLTERGEMLTTPKDVLKQQQGLRRGRDTVLEVTTRAFSSGQDLLAEFKAFVAGRYNESDAA